MQKTSTEKGKKSHFKKDDSILETTNETHNDNDGALDWNDEEEVSVPAKQGGCGACAIS